MTAIVFLLQLSAIERHYHKLEDKLKRLRMKSSDEIAEFKEAVVDAQHRELSMNLQTIASALLRGHKVRSVYINAFNGKR